jgi:AsmA-like C-terminal region
MMARALAPNARIRGGIPMKRRRICWLALLIPLGVALTPLVLWVVIVLIAPTNWARSHVVAALERSSGRSVQIDDLDVCLLGGIDLTGLRIGAPGAVGDPWLKAGRMHIDVSLLQLLCGTFRPTYIEVDGGSLRVLRREDGSFELADLVRSDGTRRSTTDPHRCGVSKLKAKLSQLQVVMIDKPTQTQVAFDGVEGEGNWEGEGAFVVTLSGELNEGPFQFTAHLDRSTGDPRFEGEFKTSDVVLDQGMGILRYLVPVLAGAPGQLQGRLALDVYMRGEGRTKESLCKSLVGQGNLVLDPINLDGTPLLTEFNKLMDRSVGEKMGSMRSDFVIQSGRITTDHLDLTLGRFPMAVSGWTDLDGRLDYQVKVDRLPERVEDQARRLLSGLDIDLKSLMRVRLSGDVDHVAITLNPGANGRASLEKLLAPEDRDRLRILGRQLKDKLLR